MTAQIELYGVGQSRQFLEVAFLLGLVVLVDGVVEVSHVGLVVLLVVELELRLAQDGLEVAVSVFQLGQAGLLEGGLHLGKTTGQAAGDPLNIHDMFCL